jgi:hypothetical protein
MTMPKKKKTKTTSNKNYKVILEYLKIRIITDNLDWTNKCIKVNNQTEYLLTNIQRLVQNDSYTNNIELPELEINNNYALSHHDIIKYWANIETNFKNKLKLIANLELNIDYFIVPYYLINNLLILGIVIFNSNKHDNSNSNSNTDNDYKIIETYNYISDIKQTRQIGNEYKFSILDGIVNCKLNKNGIITLFGNEILKDKYLNISLSLRHPQELSIKWEYIFRNIGNYLPKLEIIHKSNHNTITNFFQNRLNP